MTIREIFLNLEGRWIYHRTLTNPLGQLLGTVEGKATVRSIGNNTLHYKETGKWINVLGKQIKNFREYFYIYHTEKNTIEKRFSMNQTDAGLFYFLTFEPFVLQATAIYATGSHPCNRDVYQAKYEFPRETNSSDFSRFRLVYKVSGPEKNYCSVTEFSVSRVKRLTIKAATTPTTTKNIAILSD